MKAVSTGAKMAALLGLKMAGWRAGHLVVESDLKWAVWMAVPMVVWKAVWKERLKVARMEAHLVAMLECPKAGWKDLMKVGSWVALMVYCLVECSVVWRAENLVILMAEKWADWLVSLWVSLMAVWSESLKAEKTVFLRVDQRDANSVVSWDCCWVDLTDVHWAACSVVLRVGLRAGSLVEWKDLPWVELLETERVAKKALWKVEMLDSRKAACLETLSAV